ncbi:MAG TPA: enoyl-CoA hydratase-related protein, partial [Candidatus Polarisedimenticolia bacterium]|nr:enoyl-CoA hydratase-related protein [Candidatus Polarisedimenticolia bacterium]
MAATGPAPMSAEIQEGVGIVRFGAPPANLLSRRLAREVIEAVGRMSAGAANVIVLTGAGRAFSAGADPDDLRALASDEEGRQAAADGQEILAKLVSSGTLIIAAINGI